MYLLQDLPPAMLYQLIGKYDRSAQNSNDSPFLHKLPPETRMQIYQYALGGNTIFFQPHHSTCTDKCHRKRYRCRAHVAEESTEGTSKWSDHDYDHEQVKESQNRPRSDWKSSGDVSLELLLTCRQIYNEAVLVPFSANEFGLNSNLFPSDNRTKIRFLRDLIPDQSRAISTLHIRAMVKCRFVQQEWLVQHIKSMSGLRRLILSFDWSMIAISHSPDLLMATLRDRFDASGVSMFAMANLQTVEIAIWLTVSLPDVQSVMAQGKELVDWVESKRALLLTRASPVARTRRADSEAPQMLRNSERIRAQKEQKNATSQ
jgi:hypothetical protein